MAITSLWELLLEYIFGSFLIFMVVMCIASILYLIYNRASPLLIIFLIGLFIAAMGIGYVGAVIAIPIFVLSLFYFSSAMMNFIQSRRQ